MKKEETKHWLKIASECISELDDLDKELFSNDLTVEDCYKHIEVLAKITQIGMDMESYIKGTVHKIHEIQNIPIYLEAPEVVLHYDEGKTITQKISKKFGKGGR